MSRSRKKSPCGWMCGGPMKEWKRKANRQVRRINSVRVAKGKEPVLLREKTDLWCSPSDGGMAFWETKHRYAWAGRVRARIMRK